MVPHLVWGWEAQEQRFPLRSNQKQGREKFIFITDTCETIFFCLLLFLLQSSHLLPSKGAACSTAEDSARELIFTTAASLSPLGVPMIVLQWGKHLKASLILKSGPSVPG